ncbi:MAG: ATP-dependent helicase [Anaerolineaceae bacterium]|nr:ATP-dependent helicase [Anaerolineaceae bacterium]
MTMFKARPLQEIILKYRFGKMGVAAVPGSGKTHTLSYLASLLINETDINDDQEILVVTLVNSAVENFSARISRFLIEHGLLPHLGYRVRTLHGLAHDIVRERPDLVNLSDQFQILDEKETIDILSNLVSTWMSSNMDFLQELSIDKIDLQMDSRAIKYWHDELVSIASSFIRLSKDFLLSPLEIGIRIEEFNLDEPLLLMSQKLYLDYQKELVLRSAVDFDDLIRLALIAIRSDPDYLKRLQSRWPYILEDEAQDSSRLQEIILRTLAGNDGNWVRVGDPNQAIFETFTTANPKYLLDFRNEPDVRSNELPNSGRSSHQIIELANYLIKWSQSNLNPIPELRTSLNPPFIIPTPIDDPQPNPPDIPNGIVIYDKVLTPDEEIRLITQSVKKWLKNNPDKTAAILVPRNERGAKIVEELKNSDVAHFELLRSSVSTRLVSKKLSNALFYLSEPSSNRKLCKLIETLYKSEEEDSNALLFSSIEFIKKLSNSEDFLYPLIKDELNWEIDALNISSELGEYLLFFQAQINKWHQASILPVDQMILIIAKDIFTNPNDLALAHKLSLFSRDLSRNNQNWQIEDFANELLSISNNQRKYLGFSEEDNGFNPSDHKGKVVVATVHKAKGLEWDKVYLMSVNNYNYPFAQNEDGHIAEKWFVKDKRNLQAEVLQKLRALDKKDPAELYMQNTYSKEKDRLDYASERLRLLYVGITRAKQEVVLTYNNGRFHNQKKSIPVEALSDFQTFNEIRE